MVSVSELRSLTDALIDWFTMKNARHNRALKDLLSLQRAIEEFLTKYDLQETRADFTPVFKNMGQARIDATEITHLVGAKTRITRYIEGRNLLPLIEGLHDDLEQLKRGLFTRTLASDVLGQNLLKLRESFNNFLAAISHVEYR
jgi:hypothetical protein